MPHSIPRIKGIAGFKVLLWHYPFNDLMIDKNSDSSLGMLSGIVHNSLFDRCTTWSQWVLPPEVGRSVERWQSQPEGSATLSTSFLVLPHHKWLNFDSSLLTKPAIADDRFSPLQLTFYTMYPSNVYAESPQQSCPLQVDQEYHLFPATRYCICKLLNEFTDCESVDLITMKAQLTRSNCSHLQNVIHQMYPDEVEFSTVILQLNNLVYLYMTFKSQLSLSSDEAEQIGYIKQQILRLLGFQESPSL